MTKPNFWPLKPETRILLDAYLDALKPSLVVDVGTGQSTTLMAKHAERVIALEHNARYGDETRRLINRLPPRLRRRIDLRVVDIVTYDTPDGPLPWYGTDLPDGIDFALIDGPPMSIGRGAGLHRLLPHMAEDWEIWVDDWNREHERTIIAAWSRHYPIVVEDVSPTVCRILPE